MKKWILLLLCLLLTTVLFSCGDHEIPPISETTSETSESLTQTEISETTVMTETTSSATETTSVTETTASQTETSSTEKTTETTARNYVLYSDFGAKGDGKKDDFLPIFAAHAYANREGLPVKADEGAIYLIGPQSIGREIEIRTDTDWTGAKFIIDDSGITVDKKKTYTKPIFRITSAKESRTFKEIQSLKKTDTNIGFAPGEKCLAVIKDKSARVFIRSGVHSGKGDLKQEIVLLDENGNIDEATPLTWNYDEIASIVLYPLEETTLTVRGGEFHTIADKAPAKHTYFHRNIIVNRSNTVLENITHTVEGETDAGGAPYHGFIYISQCMDVTVKNCAFTPHYMFTKIHADGAATFGYDLHINTATDIRIIGCTQTISIDDTNYWGVFTSNFARNLTLEDCIFSRFDAHRGVYNVTIRNCTFGHQGILFVGFGLFTIEDTTVRASSFVQLREDYGATFDGKLVIRNGRFEPQAKLHSTSELIRARNNCDHYYGYQCHFPTLEIDGLFIDDTNATSGYQGIYVLPSYTERTDRFALKSKTGYFPPESVTLRGITTASGKDYRICRIAYLFSDTEITE
ncbi:MAG: right-handed parallel beta-helix repeat-containing protein [Clostridia bacterium]|nr:right-handed parallel beta-helix repeat-containing protein [Clostridia bacterium]